MQKRAFAIILTLAILSGLVVWPLTSSAAPHTPGDWHGCRPGRVGGGGADRHRLSMNSRADTERSLTRSSCPAARSSARHAPSRSADS